VYGRIVDFCSEVGGSPPVLGVAIALLLPVSAALIAYTITDIGGRIHPLIGSGMAALALFSTTSRRMLIQEARSVIGTSDGDPDRARDALPALAGRDAEGLTPGELRSAAVESGAENLADGLVGPLLGFVLGSVVSLPVAAAGAVWVKAVNTGDSMLGYETNPLGWPSARLDDLVMWVPARLTAVLLAVGSLHPTSLSRRRTWARIPRSPNAGWPMATMAAILDVQLRKPDAYRLNSDAALPDRCEANRGINLVDRCGLVAFVTAGVVVWF
jgi:adenosylcobinamide-phosphate synthase